MQTRTKSREDPSVSPEVLAYYATQSPFSAPGTHTALVGAVPPDVISVARTAQGLIIYEHVAEPFYDYVIPSERRGESHIRPMSKMLDAVVALDDRPLTVARPPEKRLIGICRHYMLLSIAILRQHGVPARGRGGFASYFNPGKFEDHWVCEYWKAGEKRWALLDSQFDAVFVERLGIRHDIHDVPRDRFLTAPEAWRKCRSGELDPNLFGIEFSKLRGLWFIAESLMRDLATLNGAEVLPWDMWGVQPRPGATLSESELAFFDELSLLTVDPDANFVELRRRFAEDERLRLPGRVFNALREREENVFEG